MTSWLLACVLFNRFQQHGLIINPAKCFWTVFYGFPWSPSHPCWSEPTAIKGEGQPATPTPGHGEGLAGVLGDGELLPLLHSSGCTVDVPPLKAKTPKCILSWCDDMAKASEVLKQHLWAPVALTTDASDYAVGAILEQQVEGVWQPLTFFSLQLRPCEPRYSTFDRKLLSLHLAVRH